MKKLLPLLLVVCMFQQSVFAQEICTSNNQDLVIVDANSIAPNKCDAEEKLSDSKNTKTPIQISSKRYFKKRVFERKEVKEAIQMNAISNLNVSVSTLEDSELKNIKENVQQVIATIYTKEEIKAVVPFSEVEEVPQFEDCKNSGLNSADCFNYEMKKHIQENFQYPEDALVNEIEGNIWVSFVINENGYIDNVKVTAPEYGESLRKEAIRIVSLLPNFIPGKQNGIDTNVSYTFPMNFTLGNE